MLIRDKIFKIFDKIYCPKIRLPICFSNNSTQFEYFGFIFPLNKLEKRGIFLNAPPLQTVAPARNGTNLKIDLIFDSHTVPLAF